MKTVLPLLLFLHITFNTHAAIRTVISNTGNGWSVAGNWSASGVPQDGDIVLIPAGITITVKSNVYSTLPNLTIRVFGTLHFAPGGKLDLGSNSTINIYTNGLITSTGSPSSVITIGSVNKYQGSADGTIVGPAYSSSASAASPNGFAQSILPVKFQSFLVKTNAKRQALLSWAVSDEEQIESYSIEKSTDGRNWKLLSKQVAKKTNQLQNNYAAIDSFLSTGNHYYRILATGFNAELFYSAIEKIEERNTKLFSVYPNPVSSQLHLNIDQTTIQAPFTITIYTMNSMKAGQFRYEKLPSKIELNISHLPKGTYRVTLADSGGTNQDQTIIIY